MGSDKVWLVHKSGFSAGNVSKTKDGDTGEVKSIDIKLDHGGHVIDKVDENVVEKVRSTFDWQLNDPGMSPR